MLDHFTLSADIDPGHYPVLLCRPRDPNGDFEDYFAYAILCLSEDLPSEWDLEPATNRLGETLEFGVDSGTACFMDATLNSEMYEWLDLPSADLSAEDKFRQDFWIPTMNVMQQNLKTCGADFANVYPTLRSNTITFGTGGDGWFNAYYGRESDEEKVSAIAIDICGYFSGDAYIDED